ncbi:MAG: hypothetical protein WCD18_08435 [Thermosynechococcaceae cyanobacterium]
MLKLFVATTAFSAIVLHALTTYASGPTTLWNTLQPNNAIAFSSQGQVPDEAADDFTVTNKKGVRVTDVSFLGIFTKEDAKIKDINLAFYKVFPEDSDLTRTPATVRVNGPADDEFKAFSLADKQLTFKAKELQDSFRVKQTIIPSSGPNAPGFGSGKAGGPIQGELRRIDVKLAKPLWLKPGAIFLSIVVNPSSGKFFRLAGSRPPIVPSPLPTDVIDRQAWFRTNAGFKNALEPDWVRGSDVLNKQDGTAEPAFNLAFKVQGIPVQ